MSGCDVSDNGIEYLCGVSSDPLVGGCQLLEIFLVRNTDVTERGIRLVLTRLKNLKYVDSRHLAVASAELGTDRVQPLKTFLKSLSFSNDGHLQLTFVNMDDETHRQPTAVYNYGHVTDLASIVDAAAELGERRNRDFQIAIPSGVAPFLGRFGQHLQDIRLLYIKDVDVYAIATTCPLLQKISFFHCEYVVSSVSRPTRALQHLDDVKLFRANSLPYEQLVHLLMSPNVTHLLLMSCNALSDEAIETAYRHHRFKRLQRLTITLCPFVSKEVISSSFLTESNSIRKMEIEFLPVWSNHEIEKQWLSNAVSPNWDLKLKVR